MKIFIIKIVNAKKILFLPPKMCHGIKNFIITNFREKKRRRKIFGFVCVRTKYAFMKKNVFKRYLFV